MNELAKKTLGKQKCSMYNVNIKNCLLALIGHCGTCISR